MDDLEDVDTPNCRECLTPLEVAGTTEHPYWWCPQCRVARLTGPVDKSAH